MTRIPRLAPSRAAVCMVLSMRSSRSTALWLKLRPRPAKIGGRAFGMIVGPMGTHPFRTLFGRKGDWGRLHHHPKWKWSAHALVNEDIARGLNMGGEGGAGSFLCVVHLFATAVAGEECEQNSDGTDFWGHCTPFVDVHATSMSFHICSAPWLLPASHLGPERPQGS